MRHFARQACLISQAPWRLRNVDSTIHQVFATFKSKPTRERQNAFRLLEGGHRPSLFSATPPAIIKYRIPPTCWSEQRANRLYKGLAACSPELHFTTSSSCSQRSVSTTMRACFSVARKRLKINHQGHVPRKAAITAARASVETITK